MSDPEKMAAAQVTLLLVEDEPTQRLLMTRMLRGVGYSVEVAENGEDALQMIKTGKYQLVLTDWEMPGMDGVALCKAVRNMRLDGYVYTLLLTARDAKEHIIAGLEAGADDYLIKPLYEPELIARLNTGRRILALEHSLRAANHRNRILSITDALTGAYNRRYLKEQLPREIERCRRYAYPLSVIMCDIDYFKNINDEAGHAAGDEVLQQFVARVQEAIRTNSDWLARYGGEEFLIVLPQTCLSAAVVVAEKIRSIIGSAPFLTNMAETPVTASFGIAATGPQGPDLTLRVDSLIKYADQCLYRAKQEGRDRSIGVEIPHTMTAAANG